MLPYTPDIYLRLYIPYNQVVWPLQLVIAAGFYIALILSIRYPSIGGRIISAFLAAAYIFVGSVFYYSFLFNLLWLAPLLSFLCLFHALILIWQGVKRNRLKIGIHKTMVSASGIFLIVLATFYSPLIVTVSGQNPLQMQFAGLAPIPTFVLTVGLYLASINTLPTVLTIIPIILLVFEAWHTFLLNDFGGMVLVALGLLGICLLFFSVCFRENWK